MRQKRDAGELTRMPPPQEMSASAPFFFSRSGTGVMDRRFLRDTREEDGDDWGNVYHMSFSGKVVDCKSFENADPTFSQMLVLFLLSDTSCLQPPFVHVQCFKRHLLTK